MKPRIPRIALERAGCWMALLMILAASVVSSQAQTPFQDARGNGSILLNDGGFIQFNIADPSIKIGYIRDISSKKKPWSLGFDVSGKLNGARASLLNKNQVAPDLKVGFTFGRKYLLTHRLDESNPNDLARLLSARAEAVKNGAKSSDDFGEYFHALPYDRLALQIGYAYKEYSLFDPNAAFDKQVFKKKFHNPSAALVYSIQLDGSKLLGVSLGIGKSNNSGALTEVDVRDINSSIFSNTVREVVRTRPVLRGDFKQSTSVFLNSDYVWYPRTTFSRIGVDFYTRSVFTGIDKGFHPGVGLFLSEKGAPTRVLGGVTVSYDQGKASVALVAGFSFK